MKSISLLFCLAALVFSCAKPDKISTEAVDVTANAGVFTKEQVGLGSALYTTHCIACHGRDLRGTEGGTALIGDRFVTNWKEKTLAELFELTKTTMPKNNPHSLDDESYTSLLAFILDASEFPSGKIALSSHKEELQNILMGTPPAPSRVSLRFIPKDL